MPLVDLTDDERAALLAATSSLEASRLGVWAALTSARAKLSGGPDNDRRWRIDLPVEIPTQNDIGANHGTRGAREAYKRFRSTCELALMALARNQKIPKATSKRWVSITRVYTGRQRAYDVGNLVGGCKAMLDAMVRCGLLVDDDPAHVVVEYHQERGEVWSLARSVKRQPPTRIVIAEWSAP